MSLGPDRHPRIVEGPIVLEWIERGACVGSDPTLFFPTKGTAGAALAGKARAICAGCEVRAECLDYAVENFEQFGIWGGTDRDERKAIRRARRAA